MGGCGEAVYACREDTGRHREAMQWCNNEYAVGRRWDLEERMVVAAAGRWRCVRRLAVCGAL